MAFGIRVVIHIHMGEFYADLSKACTKAALAKIAEMVAAFEAINFALEASF